jgi:hypothetical protein
LLPSANVVSLTSFPLCSLSLSPSLSLPPAG